MLGFYHNFYDGSSCLMHNNLWKSFIIESSIAFKEASLGKSKEIAKLMLYKKFYCLSMKIILRFIQNLNFIFYWFNDISKISWKYLKKFKICKLHITKLYTQDI
ncbi:unnamed protein product [Blepharisma stoltei]|uniref:Maturase K n=1 Tax=Blepharisma stoltei TaxID=1481888 RepID=A0AAU9JGK0_9CILI|nr:unnamed protein product [Blepharisma stoltei]